MQLLQMWGILLLKKMDEGKYITPEQIISSPLLAIEQLGKQIGAALILAPHPDDEALGCGGLIQYLTKQNISVWVCFITSGGASHPGSIKYPPIKLEALREQESIKSCEILGVDPSNIIFLRAPDSFLKDLNQEEKGKLTQKISQLMKNLPLASIIVPWRRDSHLDHRATYEIAKEAIDSCDKDIQLIEYPIWLWKNSKSEDWPLTNEVEIFSLDISEMLTKKEKAIYAHRSQTSTFIEDDPNGFQLTPTLLEPFLYISEFYFFPSKNEIHSLNKEYFDALYAHNSDPWNFRNSEYESLKYSKIDSFIEDKIYDDGLELGCSIGIHTALLASHCKRLLAIDISEEAIETAERNNKNLSNVEFQMADVVKEFPIGPFEFITMCEIGYYFIKEELVSTFQNISDNLTKNGDFLMVHWTSFVREYPLSGRQVHQLFKEFNEEHKLFSVVASYTHEKYELILWQKD